MNERVISNGDQVLDSQLDYTIVQDDSLDDSQGTAGDLNHTLQEELALRKNLDNAFADAQKSQASIVSGERSSIKQRIAHFERRVAESNRTSNVATTVAPVVVVAPKPPQIPTRVAEISVANLEAKQLKVFLRIRPCTVPEDSLALQVVTPNPGQPYPTKIRTNPADETSMESVAAIAGGKKETAKEFEFTQVFDKESTQMEVYEKIAAPLVSKLCTGNRVGSSALLFSYGITNAGKTYTVLGDVPNSEHAESWGIVPRCLKQVLQKVSSTDLKVYMSYFEIYNENVFDLLPKTPKKAAALIHHLNSKPLKIRDRNGQIVIKGLTKHPIETLEQGLQIVSKAKESRHTATNHLNRHSSRSHSVCQLTVTITPEPQEEGDDDGSVDTAKLLSSRPEDSATLWIVDLAGSERSKRTNVGSVRQKEAAYINKSLMNLMGCLTRGEKNYRDSKLTVLFMHHWMKAGPTSMIVNVHPSRQDYDETQHVLAYAISTKNIPKPERKNLNASSSTNTTLPEYGYDGHRKAEAKAEAKAKKFERKPAPVTKIPVARIQRKRKSNTLTQKETQPAQKKHPLTLIPAAVGPFAKKQKPSEGEGKGSTEAHDVLRKELLVAKKEVQNLKVKNQTLEEKLDAAETSVRAEVADEMLKQMKSMTSRYEVKIQELKARIAELSVNEQHKAKLDRAREKIQELTEQVVECEEEMVRMTQGHADEQRQAAEAMAEKEEEITLLQNRLDELQSRITKLEKSKEELVVNYERLLSDGGDEDDEHSHEGRKSPPCRKHYQKRLQCRTEPRVRRPLGIRGTPFEKSDNMRNTVQTKPCLVVDTNEKENSKADQKENGSERLTFSDKQENIGARIESKDSSMQLTCPEKQAKTDPETGAFLRPRGGAPLDQ